MYVYNHDKIHISCTKYWTINLVTFPIIHPPCKVY